jgi:hypothetical protein
MLGFMSPFCGNLGGGHVLLVCVKSDRSVCVTVPPQRINKVIRAVQDVSIVVDTASSEASWVFAQEPTIARVVVSGAIVRCLWISRLRLRQPPALKTDGS